jgi:response regulator RpfG family c-di-GMP phosphodiesterase
MEKSGVAEAHVLCAPESGRMLRASFQDGKDVSSSLPLSPDEVLVFGSSAIIEICGSVLRPNYRLATSSSADGALAALARHAPSVLIADLDFSNEGPRVCEAAKAQTPTPAVLVTTDAPEQVPRVLTVCDGVLLKPFAPNLLSARVGRLLRARAAALRSQSGLVLEKVAVQPAKSDHLLERRELARQGTNMEWPNSVCPHCQHRGVTSFDFISHRRAWYACPECRRAWIGQRQEDF